MDVILLLLAAIALLPAFVANSRGHQPGTVALVFVLHFLGLLAAGAGFFWLTFHGYVEDSGMEPSNTLPVAIPLLVFGAAMVIAGGMSVRARRAEPGPRYRCPMCRCDFHELDDYRVHRRTCGDD